MGSFSPWWRFYGRAEVLPTGTFMPEAKWQHAQEDQKCQGLGAGYGQPYADKTKHPRKQKHRRNHRYGASQNREGKGRTAFGQGR